MPTANTTARLEARISTDLHAMLKRAAELQGRTMTDFVVAAVQDAAQRAIDWVTSDSVTWITQQGCVGCHEGSRGKQHRHFVQFLHGSPLGEKAAAALRCWTIKVTTTKNVEAIVPYVPWAATVIG